LVADSDEFSMRADSIQQGVAMKNKFLNFRCSKCFRKITKWTRLPPREVHAYRVTCGRCNCFVGWGNEPQLQQLIDSGQPIDTAVAVAEPPGATLEDWF
jgi:hypothetical protein